MPLHADKNLYTGINVHLNSYLQNESGGWASFHGVHVTHLAEILDENLPPGYFARSEQSLQIGAFDPTSGTEQRSRTRPDVMLYSSTGNIGQKTALLEATSPTDSMLLTDTLPEEEALTGLMIYQAGEGSPLGRPVTRIELLSPANKPGGTHYEQYMVKRLQTLKSGLRLVEIDYLHQYPPIIPVLANYTRQEPNAAPYMILVSDPRPAFEKGITAFYAFHTDMPLPIINIPLAGADVVNTDFRAVYNRTFESARFFKLVADYAEDPVNLNTYTPEDQERIRQHLSRIRTSAQNGEPS